MKTLLIDTSTEYLAIALYDNDQLKVAHQSHALKNQSELMIPYLSEMLEGIGWKLKDVEAAVITIGPGSYTGIRIAMTSIKVMAVVNPQLKIYTLSTLHAYAGATDNVISIIDARSQKVFVGHYKDGKKVQEDCLMDIEVAKDYIKGASKVIQLSPLLSETISEINITSQMFQLKPFWNEVKQVHQLVPIYLKDVDAKKVQL